MEDRCVAGVQTFEVGPEHPEPVDLEKPLYDLASPVEDAGLEPEFEALDAAADLQ